MHAPKVDARNVRINFLLRGESMGWKRATFAKFGRFRMINHPDNQKEKKRLREAFGHAYPRFPVIRDRRLGVQLFFQTRYDSNDADNLSKQVMDAFNGVVWNDDHIVKELYARVNVSKSEPFMQMAVYLLEVGA